MKTKISVTLAALAFAALAPFILAPRPGASAPLTHCSAPFLVDVTFTNGAHWDMCWKERAQEGITLRDIYYTPPGGVARLVLHRVSLAQMHVPYDDNGARYHDISDGGFGGYKLQDLEPGECPQGTLTNNGTKDVLCQTLAPRGTAFKYATTQRQGQSLSVFSISKAGQYYYEPNWTFSDDGSMDFKVGATGRLERYITTAKYGWPVGPGTTVIGASHSHNVYWRLDFDLDGWANDAVEQIEFTGSGTSTRPLAQTQLTAEAARTLLPSQFRFWRVKDPGATNSDGHAISYEIHQEASDSFRGPTFEPFTNSDFYLTTYRSCERLASHNPTTGGCADNASTMVNGETVRDVVVWASVTFHHLPRDEDEPYMNTHWLGIQILPRDLTATNP